MATSSETSGADRIAELKKKMQESAQRAKAEREAEETNVDGVAVAEAEPVVAETADTAETTAAVATEPEVTEADTEENETSTVETTAPVETETEAPVVAPTNGAVTAASEPVATAEVVEEEDNSQAEFTRREFLTYAWGAALGLLAVEAGLVSYFFMYPRFRAGEFGGQFFLSESDVPAIDAPPAAEVAGKFWLVDTEEGPRALYMVCTHLGCLYKWEASNNRFECPCHGSKFSKDGFYIEGPAPRSLDTFEVTTENGQVIVDTGSKTVGAPATESPARAVVV